MHVWNFAPVWANADLLGKAPVDQPDRPDTGTGPVTYADLGALELGLPVPQYGPRYVPHWQ